MCCPNEADVHGGVEYLGHIQPQVEGAVEPGQLLAQLRVLLDLVLLIVLVVGLEQLELEVQRLAGRVDVRLYLAVVHRVEQPEKNDIPTPRVSSPVPGLDRLRRLDWTGLDKIKHDRTRVGTTIQPTMLRRRPGQQQLEEPLPEDRRQRVVGRCVLRLLGPPCNIVTL